MRTRKAIEEVSAAIMKEPKSITSFESAIILEVLLDIRDLLMTPEMAARGKVFNSAGGVAREN